MTSFALIFNLIWFDQILTNKGIRGFPVNTCIRSYACTPIMIIVRVLYFSLYNCQLWEITPLPFDILQYNPRYPFVTGSYCPEGTDGPLSCPPGTYGATTGLRNVSECTPCTAGSYCTTPGLTTPEGQGNSIIVIYAVSVWQLKTNYSKLILNF